MSASRGAAIFCQASKQSMSAASETYWNNFSINDKDVERVYAYMLEHNDAARLADLAQVVIAVRAQEEHERLKRLASQAVLYRELCRRRDARICRGL
ncbi:MAG: hypothetical protein DCC52_03840 [Chloroflexi bacterium]|nr:MAG: hypothetical protein DCC52_03840 [Chloroflexota bacterium]